MTEIGGRAASSSGATLPEGVRHEEGRLRLAPLHPAALPRAAVPGALFAYDIFAATRKRTKDLLRRMIGKGPLPEGGWPCGAGLQRWPCDRSRRRSEGGYGPLSGPSEG